MENSIRSRALREALEERASLIASGISERELSQFDAELDQLAAEVAANAHHEMDALFSDFPL